MEQPAISAAAPMPLTVTAGPASDHPCRPSGAGFSASVQVTALMLKSAGSERQAFRAEILAAMRERREVLKARLREVKPRSNSALILASELRGVLHMVMMLELDQALKAEA